MKKFIQKLLWPLSGHVIAAANIAEGTHAGSISKKADAAADEFTLVKIGSDADHVAAAGAADIPIGVLRSVPTAAEDEVTVDLLGAAPSTVKMIASEAISAGERVFAAASGKIQDLPAGAGTYYQVGVALTAADADGDIIEVDPCVAVATVVS